MANKNKYRERKETARAQAIEWQLEFAEHCYSYSELAHYSDYFKQVGKRYGLLKEFRENAII